MDTLTASRPESATSCLNFSTWRPHRGSRAEFESPGGGHRCNGRRIGWIALQGSASVWTLADLVLLDLLRPGRHELLSHLTRGHAHREFYVGDAVKTGQRLHYTYQFQGFTTHARPVWAGLRVRRTFRSWPYPPMSLIFRYFCSRALRSSPPKNPCSV